MIGERKKWWKQNFLALDYGIKHWRFCIFTLWLWKNVLSSITLQDFCISSIISLPGLQCRSNYLFPSWVSSFLFYLQPKMVGLPSYPAGLIFWVGIIRCCKKKNLTHIYAYLPRLQLLSCLLQNLIQRPDCIRSPLLCTPFEPTKSWDTSLSTPCRHTPTNCSLDQEERSQGRTSRRMQLWWPRSCRQRQYSFALSSPPKSYFCLVVLYFFLLFVVHIRLFGCLCSSPKSERAFNAKTWNGDKNGD